MTCLCFDQAFSLFLHNFIKLFIASVVLKFFCLIADIGWYLSGRAILEIPQFTAQCQKMQL